MTYTHAAAAIAAAALAAAGTWQVQAWRYGEQISKIVSGYADARLRAEADAREDENRITTRYIKAQNAAIQRTRTLKDDADAARTELSGLRDDNAAALRLSKNSPAACAQYATAVSGIFDQCAGEATDLAQKAGGHANDARTLNDGWPTSGAAGAQND